MLTQNLLSQIKTLKEGMVLNGRVFQKAQSSLFIDLGGNKMGIIYGREFLKLKDFLKDLKIGDEVSVKVIDIENDDGYVELTLADFDKGLIWNDLKEKKEKGEEITIKVLKINKGGIVTKILDMLAFLPFSHLSVEHYEKFKGKSMAMIIPELQKELIGQELKVKILNLIPEKKMIILSEKMAKGEKVLDSSNYKIGDVVNVEVSAITDQGVFVKIDEGKIDGLISISEIIDPQNLKVGDKMTAKIIRISNDKIYLSQKQVKKNN